MRHTKSLTALSALAIALASLGAWSVAQAESTYGYNTTGGGNVAAVARVNISITVPKVVVLRVGTAGATQDTLTYTARVGIPATPTNVDGAPPAVGLNDQALTWDGAAPTVSIPGVSPTAAAFAWTNGAAVAVSCSAPAFAAGGPALADIAVTKLPANNFDHPTGTLACGAAPGNLAQGTLYTATWTYSLDTTNAATWTPGTYSTVVTYTAAGT